MADVKVGDVVRLKSGGPAMTVDFIDGEQVTCVWFEKTKEKRATFSKGSLEPSQPTGIYMG